MPPKKIVIPEITPVFSEIIWKFKKKCVSLPSKMCKIKHIDNIRPPIVPERSDGIPVRPKAKFSPPKVGYETPMRHRLR